MHFRRPQVLLTLARTLWLRGQPDRAVAMARQVIDEIAALGRSRRHMRSTDPHCVPIIVWCGEWGEAERLLDIMDEHVERYSLTSHRGVAMALRGELLVKTGRPREGCDLLRTAHSRLKAVGNASHETYVASALAEALAATGSLDDAFAAVEGGIELAQRRGGMWELPELLRIKGVLLAKRSRTDAPAVDETLSSAIELARRQGALALELRAATILAGERLRRGGGTNNLQELAAVYAKFTEGTETPDLRAARSLLDGASATQARGAGPAPRGARVVKRRQAP